MDMKLSSALVEQMAVNGSVRAAFPGWEVRVFSGAAPSDADASIGGATLLGVYKNGANPATFAATAPGGVLSKNASETLSGNSTAAGTMSFFRLVNPSDDNGASTTAMRIQGDIGQVGALLVVPSTVLAASGVTLPPLTAVNFVFPKQ